MGSTPRAKRTRRTARATRVSLTPTPPPAGWPPSTALNLALLTAASVVLFREVFLHPNQMLWGNDIVRLHSPLKAVQFQAIAQGRFPLWDPTAFGGHSIVGDPVAAVLSPLAWLFWVSSSPVMFGYVFWIAVTVAAWGTWFWMRALGSQPPGALLAALAFAFSGKTAGHLFAGHLEFLPGVLALPWVLWATAMMLQRRTVGRAVMLGAVLCVTATLGSVQALYWHVLAVSVWVAFDVLRKSGRTTAARSLTLLFVAGGTFLLGAVAWWLPVVRQTWLLSARAGEGGGGYEFATMASATPADLLRLIWPFAGRSLPQPFASDLENAFFWESASYPGLVALSLALFQVVVAPRDRRTRGLGLAALVTLALALGSATPVYRLLYDTVPGFSLFRAPGRWLAFSNFFLAGLAGFGLDVLLKSQSGRRWIFVAVVAALLAIAPMGPDARDGGTGSLAAGTGLSLLILWALLIMGVLFSTGKLSARLLAAITLAVALLNLGIVWKHHVVVAAPEQVFASNSVVEFLQAQQRERPGRVFDPTETAPQQLAARAGLQLITGYHPGLYAHQLAMYKALWPTGEGSDLVQILMHSPKDIACTPILDLWNTRYVVAFESELDERFEHVFTTPEGEFRGPRHVFKRSDPLPRAFMVRRSVSPSTDGDVLQAVCESHPRESCLLDAAPLDGGEPFQGIVPTSEQAGELRLDFETDAPGVLVLSESWHPDWVATDRGTLVAVHRANAGFLGIPLTPGAHALRVWYRPWDFYLGAAVSGAFWLTVGLVLVLRRRHPQPAQAATGTHGR